MSYKLDPLSPMSESVRRVALAELEYAESALRSASDRHGGIHSARKCLKRLRALLALIRPGLPDPVFDNLTDRLRTIALGLAPARDAHALDRRHRQARADEETCDAATPTQSLRAWLMKRRELAERNLEGTAVSDALRALPALKPAVAGLAIYPDDFQVVAEGLRLRYKAARRAFAELSPPATTKISTSGGKACSIIGGICSSWPRAGLPCSMRASKIPARCLKFSATITTLRF